MAIIGATTEAIRRSLLTTIGDMIYASAVSTPARLAAPASGLVLTGQGVGVAPAWAAASAGALTLAGSNTTEATTTSVTAVDLLTVSVSITATTPFFGLHVYRKTTGAAVAVGLGVKINATIVSDAVAISNSTQNVGGGTTTHNLALYGVTRWWCNARVAAYPTGLYGWYSTWDSGGSAYTETIQARSGSGVVPVATITSIILRGISGDVAVTLAVDEVYIYTYATS